MRGETLLAVGHRRGTKMRQVEAITLPTHNDACNNAGSTDRFCQYQT